MSASYRTMSLYRVRMEYRDTDAYEEWDRAVSRARDHRALPSPPPPKAWVTHVAVWPAFAGDPLGRAADLAVRSIVGEPDCWEKFEPVVTSVESVGSVQIEVLA